MLSMKQSEPIFFKNIRLIILFYLSMLNFKKHFRINSLWNPGGKNHMSQVTKLEVHGLWDHNPLEKYLTVCLLNI